jgi:predicted amidohydrolase
MRVAAIQAESAWLDLDGGVDKVCSLIRQAAVRKAELVGFPVRLLSTPKLNLYTRSEL